MPKDRDDYALRGKLALSLAGKSSAGTKRLGLVLARGGVQEKPDEVIIGARTIASHDIKGEWTRYPVRTSLDAYKEKSFSIRMAEAPVKDVSKVATPRPDSPFKKVKKPFVVEKR